MRKSDDMFNRVMSKDHIAVVCLLENAATGSRLVVANVHMEWSPTFRDVKLVQAAMLMEEVEKISDQFARFPPKLLDSGERGPAYADATKIPLVVCGDFNSVPVSGVYEFLANGTVPKDHEDFMDHVYGAYTTDGLSHKFNLKSAYSNCGTLPMTNFVPTFQGAIDHIWYSQDTLAVTSLLGEVDRSYLNKVVGFPNAHFPSECVADFLSLAASDTWPTLLTNTGPPVAAMCRSLPTSSSRRRRRRPGPSRTATGNLCRLRALTPSSLPPEVDPFFFLSPCLSARLFHRFPVHPPPLRPSLFFSFWAPFSLRRSPLPLLVVTRPEASLPLSAVYSVVRAARRGRWGGEVGPGSPGSRPIPPHPFLVGGSGLALRLYLSLYLVVARSLCSSHH